jgi:hypothetical protein
MGIQHLFGFNSTHRYQYRVFLAPPLLLLTPSQVVTLLLPMQAEKRDSDPSSIASTYKQIYQVVKLPAVMRLALLLMLCKVRLFASILPAAGHVLPCLFDFLVYSIFADWDERGRLSDGGCAAGNRIIIWRKACRFTQFRHEESAKTPSRKSRLLYSHLKSLSRSWWVASLTSSGL